jgi:hypothetical protein
VHAAGEVGSYGALADDLLGAPPLLGATRLAVVDGPAGSGKTTFATALAGRLGAQVVHMDDLYEGWSGLDDAVLDRLHDWVLAPLLAGRAGRYRRYDWVASAFAEWHDVPVAGALVVEGVGAAARRVDPHATLRVWVEAPADLRLARGTARDGEELRHEWLRWMDREAAHFAADGTRARADLVVDGSDRPGGDAGAYAVVEDRRRRR